MWWALLLIGPHWKRDSVAETVEGSCSGIVCTQLMCQGNLVCEIVTFVWASALSGLVTWATSSELFTSAFCSRSLVPATCDSGWREKQWPSRFGSKSEAGKWWWQFKKWAPIHQVIGPSTVLQMFSTRGSCSQRLHEKRLTTDANNRQFLCNGLSGKNLM